MPSAERAGRSRTTLRALLRTSARRLSAARVSYGHGTTNARDEAAWLALHALEIKFEDLERHLDGLLSEEDVRRVSRLVDERIKTRKPAAYLTREAWLGPYRFYVDERVIIPRSYFLEIIPEQLASWLPAKTKLRRVVDVCTGSGCLAILLAHHFRSAQVDSCDLSAAALEVAKINVKEHELARRVHLFAS